MMMYSGGVCPCLTWLLLIQEFPITWLERQVDSLVTRYLKRWSGLGRSANTAILYPPRAMGGLNLPCLSTLHKKLQVSRQCQLLVSQDSCVCFLADRNLKQHLSLKRKRFRPVEVARDALTIRPGASRKSLVKSAKSMVSEEVNTSTLESLHSLERQGQMSRCASPRGAAAWLTTVHSLPEEPMKFALNTAVDVLPHNANLYLWRKRKDTTCPLCGANQSLLHVLNNCTVARDARRYNFRHDAVLKVIASVITPNIPQTATITVDIGEGYSFPLHIVETDLRPDLVLWDETEGSLHMVELTVPSWRQQRGSQPSIRTWLSELVPTATKHPYSRSK